MIYTIIIAIAVGLLSGYCLYRYNINKFIKSVPIEGRYGVITSNYGTCEVKELMKANGRVKLLCENIVPNKKYPTSAILNDVHENASVISILSPYSCTPVSRNSKRYTIWCNEKSTYLNWLDNNVAISRDRKLSKLL